MSSVNRAGMSGRFRMIFRKIALERGKTNEEKVSRAFDSFNGVPEWFLSIEKAPWKLDRQGVDHIVKTLDVGDIYLQVKSSRRGQKEFERRRRRKRIAVVVVNNYDTDEELRAKVVAAADGLRMRYLLNRGVW